MLEADTKRTKIVCTIGPASRSEDALRAMIRAGMNVARINFSHGTHEAHAKNIANIRRIAQEEGAVVAVMADLQGPKIRVGDIETPLTLRTGERITLTVQPATGKDNVVNLPHPGLIECVRVGDPLLLDDGALEFEVIKKNPGELVCTVVFGGVLSSHKGVSAPGNTSKIAAITDKDKEDTAFALEQGVDFLALSFVRGVSDIQELRWLIRYLAGPDADVHIVAKIEKREALECFDAILDAADAVMVARGDLGVEMSVQEVPLHQKRIIGKCNVAGKPVITATQMLQSMIENPRPTRAEASDVANAILDGTDAVMLSGETAVGKYPVDAVEMMAKIAVITEQQMPTRIDRTDFEAIKHRHRVTDAISVATCEVADDLAARLIVTSTWSGYTARQVAKERPAEPIVALVPNEVACRRLALTWGVLPVLVEQYKRTDQMLAQMVRTVLDLGLAEPGDLVVVTGGIPFGGGGRTNFVQVHTL